MTRRTGLSMGFAGALSCAAAAVVLDALGCGRPSDGEAAGPLDAAETAETSVGADAGVTVDGCVPSVETCNGKDDDCDGIVDNVAQPPGLGTIEGRQVGCKLGARGLCDLGAFACVDGGTSCVPLFPGGRPERCNGLDDDCDGVVDNGLDDLGLCVNDGGVGSCGLGASRCTAGAVRCVPRTPKPESCNGLDDDCDGLVDNPALGQALCAAGDSCQGTRGCYTPSSCPYVFVNAGEASRYETAVGGAGLIGQRKQLVEGKVVDFAPLWIRLAHAKVEGSARRVRATLSAAEDEIVYVDHLALAVVDHDPGLEVVSSSSIQWTTLERPDPGELYGLRTAAMRTPTHATWMGTEDVTAALSSLDDRAVATDLARDNFYEIDFGPVGPAKAGTPRLVIDGWKFKTQRALRPGVPKEKPRLEVEQADGTFARAMPLASPRGDKKTVAFDLSGVSWPSGRYRMRLYTGTHEDGTAAWFLDRVRMIEEGAVKLAPRPVNTERAELVFSGAPSVDDDANLTHPRWAHDDGRGELGDGYRTYGAFTRYGDVRELVRDSDDGLVVMRRGDAVELTFAGVPTPAAGKAQTLLLRAELLVKLRKWLGDAEGTELTTHVDPLPFHGMGRYPPSAEAFDAETDRRSTRALYNTRVYRDGDTRWGP